MNNWQEIYRSKLATPADALSGVRSGMRVLVGSGCAEPQTLVRALCGHGGRLADVEVVHLLTHGIADYVNPEYTGTFRHNAFFIGANVREAVRAGRADYTPIFLSEIPELIRSGSRRVDVALLTLSKPDKHGFMSMGIHVDIQRAALQSAKLVIAEVNPHMPRTFGDTQVHVSELTHVVEVDEPLLELPYPKEPDEISIRIGSHVARLIGHGSCMQMGIGNIPNAVLRFLTDKRDLGIHTEMFSDGVLALIQNGNITNKKKVVHTGKTVASFTMGTRALYDFVDDNPAVVYYGSDYVNDPRVISRNDDVVAVNSALQADLTGQVCADSIGWGFYSGIGGQVDFIRGAAMSRGGKPIIALPSTAKNGTISRIVPHLDEGSGVVTSRGDVHYVVTEYGVAYLHGKTIRARALALIGVAHPDHRRELLNFVKQKHYVLPDEQLLSQVNPYPSELEHQHDFGGVTLEVRPLRATDERVLQEFFYSHKPETVYNRYFAVKKSLGHREAAELCCVDYQERMALGAFEKVGSRAERLVAVVRYYLDPRTNFAETATVVHEQMRRRGVGSYLMRQLVEYAKKKGISGFKSEILGGNQAMVKMHERLGHQVVWSEDDGVFRVEQRFG